MGATTLSITTNNKATLTIVTFNAYAKYCYAECHNLVNYAECRYDELPLRLRIKNVCKYKPRCQSMSF
jgi:hypothetical protein